MIYFFDRYSIEHIDWYELTKKIGDIIGFNIEDRWFKIINMENSLDSGIEISNEICEWMKQNYIKYPLTSEDLFLMQLTFG